MALQKNTKPSGAVGGTTKSGRADTTADQSTNEAGHRAEPRRYNLDTAKKSQEIQDWQGRQRRKPFDFIGVTDNAKQLYDSLQRFIERVRTAVERTDDHYSNTKQVDRAIDERKRSLQITVGAINQEIGRINEQQQQFGAGIREISGAIKQRKREINQFIDKQNQQQKALDRG